MKTGIEQIKEERERQLNELGYTLEHDLMYDSPQDMIIAACIYANLGLWILNISSLRIRGEI